MPVDVYLTVDVEVWCDGWNDLDAKFANAFRSYIHGPTSAGPLGLTYQAQQLQQHGLKAAFFVEPLFAGRFGLEPLREIVGILRQHGQEVQLHLHPEWVDEWPHPPLEVTPGKRRLMRQYCRDDQVVLMREGLRLLSEAGQSGTVAHRAGSFGFNADTLHAVAACGLTLDASYNATMYGPDSGVGGSQLLSQACQHDGITLLPMTVYRGLGRSLRHVQLGACSWAETEWLLQAAADSGRSDFVMLWHNFELVSRDKTRADPVVVRRFHKLLDFLARRPREFQVRGIADAPVAVSAQQGPVLRVPARLAAQRSIEQIYRRRFGS